MDKLVYVCCVLVVIIASYISYRIGRIVGARRGSEYSDSAASTTAAVCEQSAKDIGESIEAAVRANQETAAVIQKMRDIVQRNRGSTGDSDSSTGGE